MHLLSLLPFDPYAVGLLGAAGVLLGGTAAWLVHRRHGGAASARTGTRWLLAVAVLVILAMTLAPGRGSSGTNLVPLATIRSELTNANPWVGRVNILGNLGIFLVAGLLAVPALRWGVLGTTAAAAGLSTAVELTQLMIGLSLIHI